MTPATTREATDGGDEVAAYVRENRDLLVDVLAAGSAEAKAYALALLSEAGTAEDVERAQRALEDLRPGDEP